MTKSKALIIFGFMTLSQLACSEDIFKCDLQTRYQYPNNSREKIERACNLKDIDKNITLSKEQVENYKEILAEMDKAKPSMFRKEHNQMIAGDETFKNFNFNGMTYTTIIDTQCDNQILDEIIKKDLDSNALKPNHVGFLNFQKKQYEKMIEIHDSYLAKHKSYLFLKHACKYLLREGEMFSDGTATRANEERQIPEKNSALKSSSTKKAASKQ